MLLYFEVSTAVLLLCNLTKTITKIQYYIDSHISINIYIRIDAPAFMAISPSTINTPCYLTTIFAALSRKLRLD